MPKVLDHLRTIFLRKGLTNMEIFFKVHKTGKISPLDYNEFKDRILKGEVLPQDEVQDRVLTNNEWRTVDNLRIFHHLSLRRHPSGPHLAARERAEAEMDRLSEAWRIQTSGWTVPLGPWKFPTVAGMPSATGGDQRVTPKKEV